MNITAQDIINSLFNPDDIVNIRIFDDRKNGIFAGKKYSVEAGKFIGLESILREHNAKNRGVFFVVNSGGHNDRDINRINAQFVEMDDKAYKRGLIEHFGGDPVCINESRVMRLPGYYHCKGEPVMVECLLFHPERKYTQSELSKYLNVGNTDNEVKKSEYSAPKKGNEKGLELVLSQCDFLKHCREDAETLSEHDWYAMITNLFPFDKGIEKIHEFSQAYPRYSKQETDSKIAHFQNSGTRPITCKTIAEKGFKCPKYVSGECTCKAPAALCYEEVTMETLQALIDNMQVSTSAIENLQRVRKFTKDFLFNVDAVTANAVIGHLLKQKFNLKNADIKPLLSFHKEVYKQFESNRKAKDRSKNSENIPDWYEMSERGLRFLPDILAADMAKKAPVFYAAEQYYAYKHGVPIFVPAFSDCSAGFGFVAHQTEHPAAHVSIDSAKDFLELTKIKIKAGETGLMMWSGGVPKNFAQDTVVAAEILGADIPMHKYAVQITVADVRDGALSGSTLKEASSWGKVSTALEQMVYGECTTLIPLIIGYGYHKGAWKKRKASNYVKFLQDEDAKVAKAKKK